MSGRNIASEEVKFSDAFKPGIAAGSYRFVLQQTVSLADRDGADSKDHHYYRDQPFIVQGPQYIIDAEDIHSCFPPEGATGNFKTVLPHIVFRKRALPWERAVWTGGREIENLPWMALLVLSQPEYESAGGDSCIRTLKLGELRGDDNLLQPTLHVDEADKDATAQFIDIPLVLFREICPNQKDLKYLSHLRKVDTSRKEALNMHADGQFSVLVANRLPQDGVNRVLLVSLEGLQALCNEGGTLSTERENVSIRLVLLRAWSFIGDESRKYTAGGLIGDLDKAAFGASAALHAPEGHVKAMLQRGYVPLEYRPRHSSPTFAWYRGPLAPVQEAPLDASQPPYRNVSAAQVDDQATDPQNISYASAWQLGRLLALSSAEFSKAWRNFFDREYDSDETRNLDEAERIVNYCETHKNAVERDVEGNAESGRAEKGNTPRTIMVAGMVEWLARLALLHPISFNYLVADEKLLPKEAIRYFYIDNNWIEALVDGALSIARDSNGDIKRKQRRAAIGAIVSQYLYFKENKRYLRKSDKPNFLSEPLTGFIMRSEVVSGWPGLEIEIDGGTSVLRRERLSDDVMFCLVQGKFGKASFKEPPEGLKFSIQNEGGNGAPGGLDSSLPPVWRGRPEKRVLDIASMAKSLKDGAGSAAFALRMVKSGEIQSIRWVEAPQKIAKKAI